MKRRGLFVKGQQPEALLSALLSAHLEQASVDELRGIAFELVVTRGSGPLYFTRVFKAAIRKYASERAATVPGGLADEDEPEDVIAPEALDSTAGSAGPDLVTEAAPNQSQQPGEAVEPSLAEADITPQAA